MGVRPVEVNVLDALMGLGKTSAMLNFINRADDTKRFLYITPYLMEVNRIIQSCSKKQFKQPQSFGNKLNGIKYLLQNKENIVSTHKLFSLFDLEIIDLVEKNGYTLVMDEVMEVIEPLSITASDLNIILNQMAVIDQNMLLRWQAMDYKGTLDNYKRMSNLGSIGVFNNHSPLWMFPVSTFQCFKSVYIITYLFDAQIQKYYYDYHGITYKKLYIKGSTPDTYELTQEKTIYQYPDLDRLIHICENLRLNEIGNMENALSKSWYERHRNTYLLEQLKYNCVNYFTNITGTKSKFNLWTTYKDFKEPLKGAGYTKGFLSFNMRATNDYRHKTAIAYLVNRYFNPCVKNFLTANNVEVNEDLYALSEMLQFIWRSGIREGKEIWIYVPSSRMRWLLREWIDTVSNGGDIFASSKERERAKNEYLSQSKIRSFR